MFKRARKTADRSYKWLFGTMLVFGASGLLASFVLTIDKLHILENPHTVLSCSINAALNCSTVMQTWQSSLFGFPNMIIGLMAFPVVITVAVAGLSGVRFPRPFLIAAHICYALGTIFSYWLFFQSVYVIQVLCPWCLVVTFSMTMLFEVITRYNLHQNTYAFSSRTNQKVQSFLSKDYDKVIVAGWIVVLIALVYLKFGSALFA